MGEQEKHYLEYGKCKACSQDTIYQWIGVMGGENDAGRFTLYNCLKCHGTFQLNKLERKI